VKLGELHNPKNPLDVMLAQAFNSEASHQLELLESKAVLVKEVTKAVKRKKWRKITVYVIRKGKIKAKKVKQPNIRLPCDEKPRPSGKNPFRGRKIWLPIHVRKDYRVRRMFALP